MIMASLVFTTAASAAGSSLGLGSFFTQALVTAGGLAGGLLENAIMGVGDRDQRVQRSSLQPPALTQSSYGATIPMVYGMARLAGTLIWLSQIRTVENRQTQRVRDGKFSTRTVTTSLEKTQFADFAYALCTVPFEDKSGPTVQDTDDEGDIVLKARPAFAGIRRIWADSVLLYDVRSSSGKAIPYDTFTLKIYDGAPSQDVDETIEAAVGVGQVPAFRGLGYVVFTDFRITDFGGRIPNLNVEVISTLPRIPVDNAPAGMAEGSSEVYITNMLDRTVSVLDKRTLKRIRTLGAKDPATGLGTLGPFGHHLALDQAGRLWRPASTDAGIDIITPATGAVTRISTGAYPSDVAFDATRNRMWVTSAATNSVFVFDSVSLALVQTVSLPEAPHSVIITKTGEAWITTFDRVVRFNGGSYGEIARYDVGLLPWDLAENSITGDIWVAANSRDVLAVITPSNGAIALRNAGTFPTSVRCHPDDPYGSITITTLYGNQLKTFAKDRSGLMALGTVAFPNDCLPLSDGRILVNQSKYDFVLLAEGR
jgi:DNA-binding beta-propeller fold protein YncE